MAIQLAERHEKMLLYIEITLARKFVPEQIIREKYPGTKEEILQTFNELVQLRLVRLGEEGTHYTQLYSVTAAGHKLVQELVSAVPADQRFEVLKQLCTKEEFATLCCHQCFEKLYWQRHAVETVIGSLFRFGGVIFDEITRTVFPTDTLRCTYNKVDGSTGCYYASPSILDLLIECGVLTHVITNKNGSELFRISRKTAIRLLTRLENPLTELEDHNTSPAPMLLSDYINFGLSDGMSLHEVDENPKIDLAVRRRLRHIKPENFRAMLLAFAMTGALTAPNKQARKYILDTLEQSGLAEQGRPTTFLHKLIDAWYHPCLIAPLIGCTFDPKSIQPKFTPNRALDEQRAKIIAKIFLRQFDDAVRKVQERRDAYMLY